MDIIKRQAHLDYIAAVTGLVVLAAVCLVTVGFLIIL